MTRFFLLTGCVFGGVAVILGAFGAHSLAPKLTPQELQNWHTAVDYQFHHGLALLAAVILGRHLKRIRVRFATWFFIAGVLLFSGSLYLLSTADLLGIPDFRPIIGWLTPMGGLSLVLGWSTLFWACLGYVKKRWYKTSDEDAED